MKIAITNTTLVDISVDIVGDKNPDNIIIIHPKSTENCTVTMSVHQEIKKLPGISIFLISGV